MNNSYLFVTNPNKNKLLICDIWWDAYPIPVHLSQALPNQLHQPTWILAALPNKLAPLPNKLAALPIHF